MKTHLFCSLLIIGFASFANAASAPNPYSSPTPAQHVSQSPASNLQSRFSMENLPKACIEVVKDCMAAGYKEGGGPGLNISKDCEAVIMQGMRPNRVAANIDYVKDGEKCRAALNGEPEEPTPTAAVKNKPSSEKNPDPGD